MEREIYDKILHESKRTIDYYDYFIENKRNSIDESATMSQMRKHSKPTVCYLHGATAQSGRNTIYNGCRNFKMYPMLVSRTR